MGEQALTDALLRAKQKGITIVVITQRPALLNIVDKVLILRGGSDDPADMVDGFRLARGVPPPLTVGTAVGHHESPAG